MTLGDLVLKYREDHQLSQRQFAMKCGISNGYISMIEKNVNPATGKPPIPSLQKVKEIASAMNMTLDEVMRITDGDTLVSMEYDSQHGVPKTIEARIVSAGMDDLPQDDRELLLSMFQTMMRKRFPDKFGKGDEQ